MSFPTMATEATKALLKPHRTFLYVGALLGPALSVSSLPGQKGPSRVGGKADLEQANHGDTEATSL